MADVQETARECVGLIAGGKSDKALSKVLAYSGKPGSSRFELMRVLISYGQDQQNFEVTRCALDAFEKMKQKVPQDSRLFYDVANGYQTLFDTTIAADLSRAFDCEDAINNAIRYFEKAIASNDPMAITNLGNLYDRIGRHAEAIDCYDKAIQADDGFGMALGNKALTLENICTLSGYQNPYLAAAHKLYERAIENKGSVIKAGGETALSTFIEHRDSIIAWFNKIGKPEALEQDLTHDHYENARMSEFVKRHTKFCIDNNLYLNMHLSDAPADASIGDAIFPVLRTGSKSSEETYVRDIAFRFNEICESFMTARTALVHSQSISDDLTAISKQTLLIDNEDSSASNIYVGHLKTAYKEAFSTLDKVAVLINHYLDLKHPEDGVYYHNVWYEPQDRKDTSTPVLADKVKQEWRLLGIYLLCQDLRGSKYSHLRNSLTHRYVRVFRGAKGPKGTYEFEQLTETTIDVFYKVRCAILYLLLFISAKESKKHVDKNLIMNMTLSNDQHLDRW